MKEEFSWKMVSTVSCFSEWIIWHFLYASAYNFEIISISIKEYGILEMVSRHTSFTDLSIWHFPHAYTRTFENSSFSMKEIK